MYKTLKLYNNDKIQIAAHRGMAGANIPCNTIPAFEMALKYGAAILELDLFKSTDGEIFVFHTGKEPQQLAQNIKVNNLKAEEIRKLRLVNVDFAPTQWGLNSFDEILEHFKGKCILNLDRCGAFMPDVIKQIRRHNLAEQILLKNSPKVEVLTAISELAPDMMFMPIYFDKDTTSEMLFNMDINFMGAELVFSTEQVEIIQPEYIEKMKKKGITLWGNAIIFDDECPLSAGHSDDVSLLENPDNGWGWLAERGFDIIQTDWTYQCGMYLKQKGYNK